jgi:hypothetical protein
MSTRHRELQNEFASAAVPNAHSLSCVALLRPHRLLIGISSAHCLSSVTLLRPHRPLIGISSAHCLSCVALLRPHRQLIGISSAGAWLAPTPHSVNAYRNGTRIGARSCQIPEHAYIKYIGLIPASMRACAKFPNMRMSNASVQRRIRCNLHCQPCYASEG